MHSSTHLGPPIFGEVDDLPPAGSSNARHRPGRRV